MPLTNIFYPNLETCIAFWHISESVEQLMDLWGNALNTEKTFADYHPKRQKELLIVRLLLKHLTKTDNPPLQYDQYKRPYLKDENVHISISHTSEKVVLMLHQKRAIGTDIEQIGTKVVRIQHKFMNDKELQFAGQDTTYNTIIWSAKETLYKYYGRKLLEFKEHLRIHPFKLENKGIFSADINTTDFKETLTIHYLLVDNFVVTFTDHGS